MIEDQFIEIQWLKSGFVEKANALEIQSRQHNDRYEKALFELKVCHSYFQLIL